MPSADLAAAAATAVKARTINNGQSCIAAKRFIVHAAIADEFERLFVEKMAALKIGDPLDPSVEIGPLATPAIAAEVDDLVQRSVAAGARLVLRREAPRGARQLLRADGARGRPRRQPRGERGDLRPGREPLPRRRAWTRRSRSPTAPVSASAPPPGRATRPSAIASCASIEAGAVFINGMVKSDPRLPFGGIKQSGFGRELALQGIREFVNVKAVWIA